MEKFGSRSSFEFSRMNGNMVTKHMKKSILHINSQDFWGCVPSLLQDKEIKKKQAQIEEEQAKATWRASKEFQVQRTSKGSS